MRPTVLRTVTISSILAHPFCLALFFRSLGLLLPHTYFQPDEFWQALEPAHVHVFGYGYLTWEWRDLPASPELARLPVWLQARLGNDWAHAIANAYERWIVRGHLRSWAWPAIFIGVYKVLKGLGLDGTDWLVFAPRMVGVMVAALTDWTTYRLAAKFLGPGASAAALFLSLTNLFNNHALPRLLANSPETLLTAAAILYCPLPRAERPSPVLVRSNVEELGVLLDDGTDGIRRVQDVADLDYSMMDRVNGEDEVPIAKDSLVLSVFFAACAICLRPTTLPFWLYMGGDILWRTGQLKGVSTAAIIAIQSLLIGIGVLAASTGIDFILSGHLAFPIFTFFHFNIVQNIAAFYGSTNIFYHLLQSLPILLCPIWWWWGQGFLACLLPQSYTPRRLKGFDTPAPLRTLARAIAFAIGIMSLSPHSEWRFLHPFLPPLLLFALPALFRAYSPAVIVMLGPIMSFRQFVRLPPLAFYASLVCLTPWLYLNTWHGRGAVEVMNVLRRGELGPLTGLAVFTNCHGTPWMSHLHQNVPAWFLTCEPPLNGNTEPTWETQFFSDPIGYMRVRFPAPPDDRRHPFELPVGEPSHLIFYGALLNELSPESTGQEGTFRSILQEKGYSEVWHGSIGPDILWEDRMKGGVRVWRHP